MTADVPATFNFLCRRVLSFRFITPIVAGNCLILFTTQNIYEERKTGDRDQNQMWPKYYMKNLKPWGLDRTSVACRHWTECFLRNCKSLFLLCALHYGSSDATKPHHALDKSSNHFSHTHQIQIPILFYHLQVYLSRGLSLTASGLFHLVTYLHHST